MIKYYLVGGAVRDKFLGKKSKDLDYACEAPSFDAMRADIIARGGQIFLETEQYLTIRAKMPKLGAADFVLCRRDGEYKDGRHPTQVFVGDIFDDLARRDFTVNAIAEDADTCEIIDPYNGRLDIEEKVIRCVGNAEDRFNEDALRMLRAIRFAITKDFNLHKSIVDILGDATMVKGLKNISIERVREELVRCFSHDTMRTLLILDAFPYVKFAVFQGTKLTLVPTIRG